MKSFLHGKRSLPIASLRPPSGLSSLPAAAPAAPRSALASASRAAAEPQVEVVKEGDKVIRLVVTCSCGERVEVECLYPAGS